MRMKVLTILILLFGATLLWGSGVRVNLPYIIDDYYIQTNFEEIERKFNQNPYEHSWITYIENCTASDNIPTLSFPYDIRLTTITFISESGTVTADVSYRSKSTPFTAAGEVDVLTGTVSVTTTESGASGFEVTAIPKDKVLVITTSAQSGDPEMWCYFEYLID